MRSRKILVVSVASVLAIGGGSAAMASSVQHEPPDDEVVMQTARHEAQDHGTPVSAPSVSPSATVMPEHHARAVIRPSDRVSSPCSTDDPADNQRDDADHAITATSGHHGQAAQHNDENPVGHGHD